jgi:hypothetical protein
MTIVLDFAHFQTRRRFVQEFDRFLNLLDLLAIAFSLLKNLDLAANPG